MTLDEAWRILQEASIQEDEEIGRQSWSSFLKMIGI